jgi:hypothetical protein
MIFACQSIYTKMAPYVYPVLQSCSYPIQHAVAWIRQYRKDKHLVAVASEFCKQMAELEKISIISSRSTVKKCIQKARDLCNEMEVCKSSRAIDMRAKLARLILGHQYRVAPLQNLWYEEAVFQELCKKAQVWKQSQAFFHNKNLSKKNLQQLTEVCQYQDFARLLVKDETLQEEFFRWSIVNDSRICPFKPNSVPAFVKFPGLYKEIMHQLAFRSSRFGGKFFQVDETQQVLTVLIEGKRIPVLKDFPKIVLRGHAGVGKKTAAIAEIFKEVKRKSSFYKGSGDCEIINKEGIWLWDAKQWACYNEEKGCYVQINPHKESWISSLPAQETLSFKEAAARYQLKQDFNESPSMLPYAGLKEGIHPIWVMRATQKGEGEILGTHAFSEFLFVDTKNQTVQVKSIGQFFYPFPKGLFRGFVAIANFHSSCMYSPDENIFNADRMHSGEHEVPVVAIKMNPTEWKNFINSMKKDILNGWDGKLGFNIVIAQCATRLWKKARHHFGKERIPDLRIPLWSLNPSGGSGLFFKCLSRLPLRNLVTSLILFTLGSWRSMRIAKKHRQDENVSLLTSQNPFNSSVPCFIHPGPLFKNPLHRNPTSLEFGQNSPPQAASRLSATAQHVGFKNTNSDLNRIR